MKRVIKNQKKMKNAMYIVFGAFALALFAITRINPSYADNWLMIDNALDAIVLYWEVETATEDENVDESQDEEEEISEVENEWDEYFHEVPDNEEDVDYWMVQTLSHMGSEAVQYLVKVFKHPNQKIKIAAIRAAQNISAGLKRAKPVSMVTVIAHPGICVAPMMFAEIWARRLTVVAVITIARR